MAPTAALAFELLHLDYGRSYFFVFDGGSNAGVREGMTACVDDAKGWELFCGKVERVKSTVAAVEAPDHFEAYFEVGLPVRVMELGAAKGLKKPDTDDVDSDKEAPLVGPIKRPSSWITNYVATFVLPYTVAQPDFSVDARISGTGSIWEKGVILDRSLLGMSFGRRMPWARSIDHQVDLTWRYIPPTQKSVDFDPSTPNIYALEKIKLTDLSLNWNFLSVTQETGTAPGWIAGVSGQYVSYNYTSSVIDDDGGGQSGDLATSSARLLGLTARAGARIETTWMSGLKSTNTKLSHGSAGVAVVGLLPLYAKTTWTHGTHSFPTDVSQKDQSQTQFEDTAGLKRSRFGVESTIYANWIF